MRYIEPGCADQFARILALIRRTSAKAQARRFELDFPGRKACLFARLPQTGAYCAEKLSPSLVA
jgi:hypothetical protein